MATYNYNENSNLEEKQSDDIEDSNLETEEQADVEAEAGLVENLKNNFKRKK